MLYAFGMGEAPISISGDPARPDTLVHTVRNVGNITRAICQARPGATLGVRGPFGAPWPVAAAAGNDIVIVAGGLGLAPLRPCDLPGPQPAAGLRQLRADLRRPHPGGPGLSPGTGTLARPLRL